MDNNLTLCYFDKSTRAEYVSKIKRKTFDEAFIEYSTQCAHHIALIDMLFSASGEDVIQREAANILNEVRRQNISTKSSAKPDDIPMDEAFFMALYLIPMIKHHALPCCESLANAVHREWMARYPKRPIQIGTYEEISAGFKIKKHGLCFITTAVCQYCGLPDDCHELTVLRAFRDNNMMKRDDGRLLVEEYYEIAPPIVTMINHCDDKDKVYTQLCNRYILPCVTLAEEGNFSQCEVLYKEMVLTLKQRYLS